MKKFFLPLLALFVLVFVSFRLFYPLNKNGEPVSLDIPPGQTFYKLAKELKKKNLIRSEQDMKFLVRFYGRPALPQGEYEVSSGMSLWTIFQNIRQGKEKTFIVQFPEGLNHYEMAEILKNHNWPATEDFLKKVWDKNLVKDLLNAELKSFEGYLFPESYHLRKYMSAEDLIELMVKTFLNNYKSLPISSSKIKFQRHSAVTLASLIEKETGQPKERGLISSVFHNRLNQGMKLQTDPSILYAMYLARGFHIEKNIRKKDILFPSAYNTYVIKALPPGPVANPGKASLQAVFFPEKSDYLYFVSKNDGSHHFSKNYREHKKAVYKYQIKYFEK